MALQDKVLSYLNKVGERARQKPLKEWFFPTSSAFKRGSKAATQVGTKLYDFGAQLSRSKDPRTIPIKTQVGGGAMVIGGALEDIGRIGQVINRPKTFSEAPSFSLESFTNPRKFSKASILLSAGGVGLDVGDIARTGLRGGLGRTTISALDKGAFLDNETAKSTSRLLKEYDQIGKQIFTIDGRVEARRIILDKFKIPVKKFTRMNDKDIADVLRSGLNKNQTYAYYELGQNLVERKPKRVPEVEKVLAKGKKQIGRVPTKKPVKQHLDEFYTNWVNRFHPIEKLSKGLDLKSTQDPSIAIKRLLGAGAKSDMRFKTQLQPILDQVKDIDADDVDLFLKAKRDIELAGRGIKGSSRAEAEGILAALSSKYDIDKLDNFAQQLYGYQRENLDILKESGFLSDQAVETITSANKSYVPFNRIIDEVNDYLGLPTNVAQQAGQPLKKIKGSERAIESPIESVMVNTFKTEAAVSKNRVSKLIANLPNINPEYKGIIQRITDTKHKPHIAVWENGQKAHYQVPPEIERAVKGLNEEATGMMVDILSAPARILRQGATGRNLEFMLPNVFRDQFDAAVNAKDGYIPFVDYLIGLQHILKHKYGGGDDLVAQWIESGGKIFFESMSGRKTLGKQLKDVKPRMTRRLMNWALGGLDTIGELSETPTRIGVFRRSLKKTGDPLRAAASSREATLDFARMGAKMRVANAIIPFLNVGVQGFDRMARTFKNNPKRAAMVLTAFAGLPQLAISLYNNFYHAEEYAQVPDFEKEGNFIIMSGTLDKEGLPVYMKIPKGHVTELVANPTDNFITWLAGSNPQTFGQLATAMISSSLPVLGQGNEPGEVARRTLGNLTPQALKPGLQLASNYDLFRGRQIVPEYMTKKPPEEQVFKSTPALYKKAGDVLGVSPLKVKNFAETSLAGFAKQPVNLTETFAGRGSVNKTPITRRFIGSYTGFDTERPEKKEGEGILSRLLKPTEEVSAAEELLPTRLADLEVLYKDAKSTVKTYPTKSAKLRVKDKADEIPELQEELVEARNILRQIEEERPGEMYQLELKTMKRSKVADRAKWVVDLLQDLPESEREARISELWEEKIITSRSNGVAQYIEDHFDIDVWKSGGASKKKGTVKIDFRKFVKTSSYSPRVRAPRLKLAKTPKLKRANLPEFSYKGEPFTLKN